MENDIKRLIRSWADTEGHVNSIEDILSWVERLNQNTYVNIEETTIGKDSFWRYDPVGGQICNQKGTFFSIAGIQQWDGERLVQEQPILLQAEIGYLGMICQEIEGVLHFLMQAKIEPGNINCIQISPTIQATKSNFTRAHGGRQPLYFEYFRNAKQYHILFDQIQSEQSSRFYKKRNRNMILEVREPIPEHPNFRWMTLGQIKELMRYDNLVNMDTRTVLSGMPFATGKGDWEELEEFYHVPELFSSMFREEAKESLTEIYHFLNNDKMFCERKIKFLPLHQMKSWVMRPDGIECRHDENFMVKYYDIAIDGREVQHWTQPLFKALGKATFGLICRKQNGSVQFLVQAKAEIGAFDGLEVGPSVQWEPVQNAKENAVDQLFKERVQNRKGVFFDTLLSEEGGRFYHEQNRNVLLEVESDELQELPEGYFWTSYATLNYMVQINNCLNIQLRNLLSLLKI